MTKILYILSIFQLVAISTKAQSIDSTDKNRLKAYITSASDSASNAYTLLNHATQGKWAGYNLDSMRAAYEVLSLKARQREIEFIMLNPDSYAAMEYFNIRILNSYLYKLDSINTIFSNFSIKLRETPLGQSIATAINKRKSLSLHTEMPNFSFKTSTGEKINISSFRNKKYVLLCFWDSYCLPCIKSIPILKGIAEKYDKELQLIHVSLDREESKWLASLEKYPMPWPQTLNLAPYNEGGNIKSLYDIQFMPQYFLIDKEGKLVYHNAIYDEYDTYPVLQGTLQKIMAE